MIIRVVNVNAERRQKLSQRLACVRRVKTRKIKDDVTAQSAVRDYYEAAVRVTSHQSDRRWKAFQQYDGIIDAVRYGTQYPHGDKL